MGALASHWHHLYYSTFAAYDVEAFRLLAGRLDRPVAGILDIGCGTGTSTRALRIAFPNARLLGVDVSASHLDVARRADAAAGIEYLEASAREATTLIREHRIDMALAKNSFHHFEDDVSVSDLADALPPGGVLVVVERTRRSAASFPAPEAIRTSWCDLFSPARERRLAAAVDKAELDVTRFSFGRPVTIPAGLYIDAARHNVFFSPCRDDSFHTWLVGAIDDRSRGLRVWEEHWFNVFWQRT